MLNVIIGCDHRGFELKTQLIDYLVEDSGLEVQIRDVGAFSEDSVDYPNISSAVTKEMRAWKNPVGILICGSGHGVNIAANRIQRVRSVTCRSVADAGSARMHNDANVIALGADFTTVEDARRIVKTFLTTEFDGGERHVRRIKLIDGVV